jgi:hypothetical protein
MHRYVRPGQEGVPIPLDSIGAHEDDEVRPDTLDHGNPFEKFNPLLHGGAAQSVHGSSSSGRHKARPAIVVRVVLDAILLDPRRRPLLWMQPVTVDAVCCGHGRVL